MYINLPCPEADHFHEGRVPFAQHFLFFHQTRNVGATRPRTHGEHLRRQPPVGLYQRLHEEDKKNNHHPPNIHLENHRRKPNHSHNHNDYKYRL